MIRMGGMDTARQKLKLKYHPAGPSLLGQAYREAESIMALLRATAAIALMAAIGVALTCAPAKAAEPACQTESATPGQRITAAPWAQQRFAPDRLAPLADGSGVTVAVIDSGVDAKHAQLSGQVVKGTDFLDRGGTGRVDCVGHGTEVASIIAARKVDKVGFRGLAPGAKILPVRISEKRELVDGTAPGDNVSATDFAKSIDWAVDHDADVINMSVVLYQDKAEVRAAITRAVKANVVVVAAAGNQNDKGNPRPYPAAYDGVLGAGAIGQDGTRLPQSQVGEYVDVVAPGGNVTAAATGGGQVGGLSGTSFAAPFVSATAALLRQYHPTLSAQGIIRRIKATADPAPGGRDSTAYGAGVLNPYRAVSEAVTSGDPERAAPLPAASVNPAVVAAERHQARTRRLALWLGVGGGTIAAVVVLCAVVIPHGVRRRWRPAT
jgi:type VII secretion-associated serine protease mycosin